MSTLQAEAPSLKGVVELQASELRDLLEPVIPFAVSERSFDRIPVLQAVRLFTFEGHLAAMATDRYRAGLQFSDIEAPDVEVTVPLGGLKAALRAFRPTRAYFPSVTMDFGAETLTITGPSKDPWSDTASVSINLILTPEYPKLESLIADTAKLAVKAGPSLNPALLSAYPHPAILSLPEDPAKAVVVRNHGDFIGIIMSLRPGEAPSSSESTKVDAFLKAVAK